MHTLLTGISRKTLKEDYISSTVILWSELLKLSFSLYMFLHDKTRKPLSLVIYSSLPLSIPAFIYFINNNLAFIALQSLSPSVYATMAQMKLLTTAIFAVIMLGKRLSNGQWRALALLTIGSILVQRDNCGSEVSSSSPNSASYFYSHGSIAMILYAVLSGFAGIYFEKVLKSNGNEFNIWARNIQLGMYSIFFSILSIILNDWHTVMEQGYFHGYSPITWLIVLTSATGGILVALVVKYADNILKGFATAFAIILTSTISYTFLGSTASITFVAGAVNVIVSVFIYNSSKPVADNDDDDKNSVGVTSKHIFKSLPQTVDNSSSNLFRRPAGT